MPSRICVKNLPKYVAEDRLRELFSQKGEITDAKLMRTKEGKSRQFAFIGFRTQQEAEEAIKYFNKSFIDTSRITCEVARKVGDPEIPRPWSRYSQKKEDNITANVNKDVGAQGSSIKVTKEGAKNSKKGIEEEDPQLQEFLQIMQPRSKAKLWANDALIAPGVDQNVKAGKEDTQAKKGGGKKLVPVDLKLNENDSNAAENVQLNESDSHAPDQSHNLACDEVVSDMDYFNSRVKKEWSDSESESREEEEEDDNDDDDDDDDGDEKQDSDSANDSEKTDQSAQHDIRRKDVAQMEVEDRHTSRGSNEEIDEPAKPPSMSEDGKDEVLDTSRLFVRNLPYTATEDDLEEHFSRFGGVTRVHLLVDKDTKRSKGIAYIQYTLPDSAARALEELDKSIFQGRLLHVMPAKQKAPSDKQETDVHTNQATKTFKQRREEERKASEASGNSKAWNSLFMRPDTIVENIARRHGVSKGDLLDREADDLAVRIALGETQVIAETKMALANSGVNVTSLEEYAMGKTDGMKRSNHVLLVKNLPYGSSEGELAKMFSKFGSLDKVILPPTKTLGLVVFLEPSEARAAFKGMAYKRYKDAPLYLEWAPANVLTASKGNDKTNAVVGEHDAKREILEQSVEGILEDMDPDRIEARSLFVKNLNFKTSEDSLRKHFGEQIKKRSILSVRIKKHLKNGKNVSMGYGFIELDSMETATNVCRDLQGTVLDGHALILQLCHAKEGQVEKKVEKDKSSTKLLVRNVAFEATEKDLRQLFSPFGQVKSLRLPRKFGNHRGFAFVEFVTKQEAQNALGALANTHLYGRHLVLERAKEGESLEELRTRTAAQFADDQNAIYNPTKLSKKRKDVAVLDEGKVKFQRVTE